MYDSKSGQMTNTYIPGDERSFTIIAWPVPEIGAEYEEIFDEVIRINTLDAQVYEKVQQTLIDSWKGWQQDRSDRAASQT